MLDRLFFVNGIGHLSDWFKESISPTKEAILYEFLSDLTEEEFQKALRSAFRERQFFPTAQWLRDQVRPSPEDLARNAWLNAMDLDPRIRYDIDDPCMIYALKVVGGIRFLKDVDMIMLPKLQENFISAYQSEFKRIRTEPESQTLKKLLGTRTANILPDPKG